MGTARAVDDQLDIKIQGTATVDGTMQVPDGARKQRRVAFVSGARRMCLEQERCVVFRAKAVEIYKLCHAHSSLSDFVCCCSFVRRVCRVPTLRSLRVNHPAWRL